MTSQDYKDGYKDGFKEGYEFGKKAATPPSNPYTTIPNDGWKPDWLRQLGTGSTCSVCGMFFEHGKAYGYVCPNHHCPSKVTCVTSLTTGVAPGSPVSTTRAATSYTTGQFSIVGSNTLSYAVNTTPDGLSYEEIYGSVVYQQNKKKE
jgi:hypothetical protein